MSPDPSRAFGGLLWALLALLAVTAVALAGVAFYAAERFEQRDRAREQALAESALRAELGEMSGQAKDLAWWDQAIRNLVEKPDLVWADDNIGSYLTDAFEITVAIVVNVDGSRGVTFIDGIDRTGTDLPEFSSDLLGFFHQKSNKAPMEEPDSFTSYVRGSEELYVLAAAALTHENPTEGQLQERPRPTLILGRALSGPFQVEVAEHYLLDGARAVMDPRRLADDTRLEAVPVRGPVGDVIGQVVWNHDPGAARFKGELAGTVIVAIIALGLTGGVFGMYLWRTRSMARATNSALGEERRLLDARTHLLTTIAHDLKTPLTAMQTAADLLLHFSDRMDESEKRTELQMIQDRIVLMDRVISEALAIGTDDEHQFHPDHMDPAEAIRELWQRHFPQADRGLELTDVRLDRSDELIDRTLFDQTVGNVLSNALKYGANGSPVRVRLSRDGEKMTVAVSNEGIGIPLGEAARVSEAFYRASNADGITGVGLGLSIALRAAKQHGGDLSVQSDLGDGAIVAVTLDVTGNRSARAE